MVRQTPPLRLSVTATTPNGNSFRWGEDERRPENVFSGLSFSTIMPGGFETMECTLPRKAGLSFQDLTRLSTLTIKGAGGSVAGEYRLERAPRVSGDQMAVSPGAVGWQAHLEDDPEAAEVYVDRSLESWEGMSRLRRLRQMDGTTGTYEVLEDPTVDPDTTTGIPSLTLKFTGTTASADLTCEAWYDAGGAGARVKDIYYDYTSQNTTSGYSAQIGTSSDDLTTASSLSSDLLTGTNSSGTATQASTAYRHALAAFYVTALADEKDHVVMFRRLTVWGNHGLSKQGVAPADGVFASDVIANAVGRWCPLLGYTTGAEGTIKPTAFIIPQLAFREPTTAAEIIKSADRFHLGDWAVWEGKTFYYNERNGRGKRWRARVGPARLQETGPQVDRLFNSAIVTYQDVDGTTKTVGPTGALTDATSADLLDTDPLNPVNQLGIRRPALLDMGIVSTATAATEVGRRFLLRSKELDTSGQAELVGYLEDDHGVLFPAWAVRAGDQISFVDASSDTSYRRVVHTSYSHDSRSNSIDLDSPPEGMAELLERLGVALTVGTSLPGATATSGGGGGPGGGGTSGR